MMKAADFLRRRSVNSSRRSRAAGNLLLFSAIHLTKEDLKQKKKESCLVTMKTLSFLNPLFHVTLLSALSCNRVIKVILKKKEREKGGGQVGEGDGGSCGLIIK